MSEVVAVSVAEGGESDDQKMAVKEDGESSEPSDVRIKAANSSDPAYVTFCGIKFKEKRFVLSLFTIINVFLFMDQNLLAPNLTIIAEEFNMTEDERDTYLGGYVSLGFFAVGGIIAVIVGYLADSINRKWTFGVVVVLGELSCMLTYWVPTGTISDFWVGLWLTRTCTGIALGGAVPIQYSIFGDFFSPEERGKAVAFINIALGLGAGGGQFLAGYMSPDWRTPFLVVSVPAFILVFIFLRYTSEPKRGSAENLFDENGEPIVTDSTITWEKFRNIFSKPSAILIFVQGLPGILPWGVAQVFLNDFLNVEKELSAKQSANVLSFWGIAIAASIVLSGVIFDRVYKKNKVKLPIFAGLTTLLAPWLVLYAVRADPQSAEFYAFLLIPSGFLAGFAGIIVKTLLVNVTIPETRGSAFAIQSLVDELGKGLGPYMVSQIIVAAGNRTDGISIAILMWIPCGFAMLLIARYIEADVKKTEEEIKRLHELSKSRNNDEHFQIPPTL